MQTSRAEDFKVVVAGGSIAGCTIAALLHRIGIQVKVLERSTQLHERGAGIVLPVVLLKQCIELGLFDEDIPYLPVDSRTFWVNDSAELRQIWQQPITLVALNWSAIYDNLRRRVPDQIYHSGIEVQEVVDNGDHVSVQTNAGKEKCDLLIAANGVNSTTRTQLYPEAGADYAGYVAWRGTIPISKLPESERFKKNFHYYFSPNGFRGHFLRFPIPAPNYQATGQVILNWMLYEAYPAEKLKFLLIDKTGKLQKGSIPRNFLSKEHITYLHKLAKQVLPAEMAEVIMQTEAPFLQVIYDSLVPQFVNRRIAFSGDAGMTLRPHSGSGAGHAIAFGIALAEILKNNKSLSIDALLNQWNQARLEYSQKQAELSKNIGDALVMHSPRWDEMNQKTMTEWWEGVMKGRQWHVTDSSTNSKQTAAKHLLLASSTIEALKDPNPSKINLTESLQIRSKL